jgi:hypothetical protein
MKKKWRVQLDAEEEHIDADEIEITASGVLVFYRYASRMEKERTLLVAFAPGCWRSCRLDTQA